MTRLSGLKVQKRTIIDQFVKPHDGKAAAQVLATLLPIAALWWAMAQTSETSYGWLALLMPLMCLFLLRSFVLMHECGHGSLFRTGRWNKFFGFVFGVITGMPQYVWSQHHQYHHSTNGNWDKYRGPLSIVTAADYAAMNAAQQRKYRNARRIWLAPVAGLMYLIVNPRKSWIKGSLALLTHIWRGRRSQPGASLGSLAASFETPYWSSWKEYRHMAANSMVLILAWGLMVWWMGPWLFAFCYITVVSVSGGGGILLFAVQHNFEHAYASGDEGWDYDEAAIAGTSFLVLHPVLNWFTANIAYHHVHHLSARIPNYCLAACHHQHADLFAEVRRIRLREVPAALRCILWDTASRRIISVAEFEQQTRDCVPA